MIIIFYLYLRSSDDYKEIKQRTQLRFYRDHILNCMCDIVGNLLVNI